MPRAIETRIANLESAGGLTTPRTLLAKLQRVEARRAADGERELTPQDWANFSDQELEDSIKLLEEMEAQRVEH